MSLSEKVKILTDIRRTVDRGFSYHCGIDYQIIERVNFRLGLDTGVSSFHFGLAYNFKEGGSIDAGFSNHQFLGITPALSVGYEK